MKWHVCVVIALALAGECQAQRVSLPPELKIEPGRMGAIKVEWEGDDVKWVASPSVDVFREFDPDSKIVRLRIIGYERGTAEVLAVACKGGKLSDIAVCRIVVGATPVPPPGPTPDEPLAKAIREAFALETGTDRLRQARTLGSIYRAGAETAKLERVTTWLQLFEIMRDAAAIEGLADKLPKVRAAIAAHLSALLPVDPAAPLTDRAVASRAFLAVALALEALKE